MSIPACEHCLSGCMLPGKPAGSMERTSSGISYYLATPAQDKKDDNKFLILCTDFFGLSFNNNKVLADKMAEQGYKVYVPDILKGEDVPLKKIPNNNGTTWDSVKFVGALVQLMPWFYRHRSAVTLPLLRTFTNEAKAMNPGHRVGITGYCFGGLYSVYMAADPQMVDVGFACHPAQVTDSELHNIHVPFGFAVAETDPQYPPAYAAKTDAYLKSNSIPTSYVVYPGTTHGFAARPNFDDEQVRTAFYAALKQTVDFFDTYL